MDVWWDLATAVFMADAVRSWVSEQCKRIHLFSFKLEKGDVGIEGRVWIIIQLLLVGVHNTDLAVFLVS